MVTKIYDVCQLAAGSLIPIRGLLPFEFLAGNHVAVAGDAGLLGFGLVAFLAIAADLAAGDLFDVHQRAALFAVSNDHGHRGSAR